MEINEFKDRLFDILNETEGLPIQDIAVEDDTDTLTVYLTDHTRFSVHVERRGSWRIQKAHELS